MMCCAGSGDQELGTCRSGAFEESFANSDCQREAFRRTRQHGHLSTFPVTLGDRRLPLAGMWAGCNIYLTRPCAETHVHLSADHDSLCELQVAHAVGPFKPIKLPYVLSGTRPFVFLSQAGTNGHLAVRPTAAAEVSVDVADKVHAETVATNYSLRGDPNRSGLLSL